MEKYQNQVYQLLAQIPKGKVVTYGQIAKKFNIKSARLVGRILHVNDDPVKYPCYKVVFADGRLTQGYAAGGLAAQRKHLQADGIVIKDNRIDLAKYRYKI